MRNKKFYLLILIILVSFVGLLFYFNNSVTDEERAVADFYPEANDIELINDITDDMFILNNFPGIKRAYKVDGKIKSFVSNCVGYNASIDVLVSIDSENDNILGIKILAHEEDLDYAGHIESDWFLDRFKSIMADKFLNLVILDKEDPQDIVQITGATVSSQAIINATNAAIGTYQYIENDIEMESVADVVAQEMWQQDSNSFAINWDDGSFRINTDEIKEYEYIEVDAILINTTGTETDISAKGPTLRTILEKEGLNLDDFEGIGVTGRDGYYTLIDKEKLETRNIILAWEVNGEPIIREEKPIRLVIPDELGPYWVKMVSNVDLYKEISPKDIEKVHIFDYLVEDIKPYYYEYYGSKDESYEVGHILRKFDTIDQNGLFTMAAVDGLIKNETISLVRARYFIKVEGEDTPMNISPNFKRGMNVKNMIYFSTTKDAVIFPKNMAEIVRTREVNDNECMLLEDVLLTAGMRWDNNDSFVAVRTDGTKVDLNMNDMLNSYIFYDGDNTILFKGENIIMDNLLRIEK